MATRGQGAIVMGTGIVSIGLSLDGERLLSWIWLILTAVAWAGLVARIAALLACARTRPALREEARSPAALTWVAATAVLGSGLMAHGLRAIAIALLVAAAAICVTVSPPLVRHRRLPRTGAVFMPTVAVQSLAVLAALAAAAERQRWLTLAALAAWGAGLALYPLELLRFELRQLLGGAGEQWIAGGALAISALAGSEISLAAVRDPALDGSVGVLHALTVAILAASLAWLAVLCASELARPRPSYDVRRWSTLFPVGMYAAASFGVARAAGLGPARSFASGWTWVAVGLWLALAAGLVRRAAVARPPAVGWRRPHVSHRRPHADRRRPHDSVTPLKRRSHRRSR